MNAQLRSELAKLRSTRTLAGLLAASVTLVAVAILLHAYGLPARDLAGGTQQRGIFVDVGVNLGAVFATLLGALSMTAEIRTGTIRPTLLVTPRRARVIAAKALSVLVPGFVIGVLATAVAAGLGSAAVSGRGLSPGLDGGDYVQLIGGGGIGAALWAVIGVGVGAIVRAQVPTVVALLTWLLVIENLLADLPGVHRYVPGALAQALAGQTGTGILRGPATAALLLTVVAVVAVAIGTRETVRRDVA